LKNVLAAEATWLPTTRFVLEHAARFAGLSDPLDISFDDFIQTSSDPRHAPAVTRLWQRVAERGDLYRRCYQGQYCVGCEQFYTSAELVSIPAKTATRSGRKRPPVPGESDRRAKRLRFDRSGCFVTSFLPTSSQRSCYAEVLCCSSALRRLS
jgi:hypothetical protein